MECVTMFREDYLTICENGRKKLDFFRSRPFGYFLSAMLAGMFIALGSFAAMCIGGFATAAGSTAVKFLVSLVFAAALSLVIAAGCELFTGNNLVLGAASLNRTVSWRDTALLWFVCYVGNLLGSWVLHPDLPGHRHHRQRGDRQFLCHHRPEQGQPRRAGPLHPGYPVQHLRVPGRLVLGTAEK